MIKYGQMIDSGKGDGWFLGSIDKGLSIVFAYRPYNWYLYCRRLNDSKKSRRIMIGPVEIEYKKWKWK